MPRLVFWYEFASTYSYLAAMRIDEEAAKVGVEVAWQPFLLGPIFKAQGWDTSPFNIYPAKGRYMVRDMERITEERGLPFKMPQPFPANSLKATRIAIAGTDQDWLVPFSKAVFTAGIGRGEDISDDVVLARILGDLTLDFARISELSSMTSNKDRLKQVTARAVATGVFGAPAYETPDGELFWGDDRLEHALQWMHRVQSNQSST